MLFHKGGEAKIRINQTVFETSVNQDTGQKEVKSQGEIVARDGRLDTATISACQTFNGLPYLSFHSMFHLDHSDIRIVDLSGGPC